MTDHKNHNVNLLDEAADNEKVNIVADAVMSRTRENDFKETIRQKKQFFEVRHTVPVEPLRPYNDHGIHHSQMSKH